MRGDEKMTKMQILTTISHEEIAGRADKLNQLYSKKLDNAIIRLGKMPGFMLGGQKEMLLADLSMKRTIVPIRIMEERKIEAFTSVVMDVSDEILGGLANSRVVQAMNKAKLGPTKEKILKDLMKDFDAENGKWLE